MKTEARTPYVLGVDGGATKTVCVVANQEGIELGRGIAGPANYLVVGQEKAKKEVKRAITEALSKGNWQKETLYAIFAGLAGVATEEEISLWQNILRDIIPTKRYLVDSDGIVALRGALGSLYGVVVVCGTGSVALGVDKRGMRTKSGGWGHILGDEGSGYDIGKKAITAVLNCYDGRGQATRLEDEILKYFGVSSLEALVRTIYKREKEKQDLASLTPLVVEMAKQGDVVSEKILMEAGRELAKTALAVIKRLKNWGEEIPVSLTGGVGENNSLVYQSFSFALKAREPRVKIVSSLQEPVQGAVFLALESISRG